MLRKGEAKGWPAKRAKREDNVKTSQFAVAFRGRCGTCRSLEEVGQEAATCWGQCLHAQTDDAVCWERLEISYQLRRQALRLRPEPPFTGVSGPPPLKSQEVLKGVLDVLSHHLKVK